MSPRARCMGLFCRAFGAGSVCHLKGCLLVPFVWRKACLGGKDLVISVGCSNFAVSYGRLMTVDMTEKRMMDASLRGGAMNMGTVLGLYYVAKFCLFPLGMRSGLAGMLFIVLTLLVPVVAHGLTKRYRLMSPSAGFTGVGQAWRFVMMMFVYASLLVAVAHYVYFAFIDHGALMAAYDESLAQFGAMAAEVAAGDAAAVQAQIEMMRETMNRVAGMSPIEMTMELLVNNVFWGCVLGLPIAVLNGRRVKE